jgi:hypothetical protein
MAAYKMYEIYGKNYAGKRVSVFVRLLATPSQIVAEFFLHEKYPSATEIRWTSPAARNYPKPAPKPVKVKDMATDPVRRAG